MDDEAHRQIESLLPRYAALQREGRRPAELYPQVADHLAGCSECRELLDSLLAPAVPPDTITLNPEDLPFFKQSAFTSPLANQQPLSPPAVDADPPEVMRGFSAIQGGGRLLMQKTFEVGERSVTVVLTLHPGATADTFTIAGEIYADARFPGFQAYLDINGVQHIARSEEGELIFQNVKLDRSDPHFDLTLEMLN